MKPLDTTPIAEAAGGQTRRSFYIAGIYAIGAAITAALALPAAAYLLAAPKTRRNEEWVDIGDVTQLAVDRPVEMVARRNRADGWKIVSEKVTAWVVKSKDNRVVAFGPQCTHLGCAHHWDDGSKEFVCPCHNSLFAADGRVISGPAPRPLDRYDLKVESGRILLGGLRGQAERSV
jgi:menaquinol-cytochrome c reductase iron-sulfur subunit